MENQAFNSSSSSSTPKPKKLKSLIVAAEESKEKATWNNNLTLGSPPQELRSERRVEILSFGSVGPVRRGREIMITFGPPESNKIYTCNFCQKWFADSHALSVHQNAHKEVQVREKKRKEMEAADLPGRKPRTLLGGYALSNVNHREIPLEPLKGLVYPPVYIGVNGEIKNMPMAVDPGMTPTRFFTENTSTNHFPSEGLGPFPSNNNMYPYIPRMVLPFPPPRTSSHLVPQENDLSEEILIPNVEANNDVEIDDEDQTEEEKFKRWGMDLSLSL